MGGPLQIDRRHPDSKLPSDNLYTLGVLKLAIIGLDRCLRNSGNYLCRSGHVFL